MAANSNNNNKKDDNKQSSVKQFEKEVTSSKKISEPMDIVVGFQSGANRVRQYGGEVEYGREFLKVRDNAVYGREYVKYKNQNNQLVNELKTEYEIRDENVKALENIVNTDNQKRQGEKEFEALKTIDTNSEKDNDDDSDNGSNES